MFDPLDSENRHSLSKLARNRFLTSLIMGMETVTLVSWRILLWIALFMALWFVQIPSLFGAWGINSAPFVFLAGLVFLIRKDISRFHWPDRHRIDRRLERESGLLHRPLAMQDDKLANPAKAKTKALWECRKSVFIESINKLRLPGPRIFMAEQDPAALRIFIVLFLVVSFTVAGPQWQERLRYGLYPFDFSASDTTTDDVMIWITPPDYTGRDQIVYQEKKHKNAILDIPAGSKVKARVNGGFGRPTLVMGDASFPMAPLNDKTFGIEREILQADTLEIRQTLIKRAGFSYRLIADKPPEITMTAPPETLDKGELQFSLSIKDDYGVQDLRMTMTLDPMVEDKPLGAAIEDIRAVMSPPEIEIELQPLYDLAWHPWAGLPVIITLEVNDHLGQKSHMEPIHMVLPERRFVHPVAKVLIESRQMLAWDPVDSAPDVTYRLTQFLPYPETFQHKIVVFLSLRSMASRLRLSPSIETATAVIPQLWDTALSIEEGNLSLAVRNLQNAQRALEQALKNPDITNQELARLMDDLREAMAEYFGELARALQKQMAEGGAFPDLPPEAFSYNFTPDDIASFLDRLQSEAFAGNKGKAREMLSQIQKMMDMLSSSTNFEMPANMKFMESAVGELQELIEKQQALLEQTQEQIQQQTKEGNGNPFSYPAPLPFDPKIFRDWGDIFMPPAPQHNPDFSPLPEDGPEIDTQEHRVEQDALRYILGQLMLEADQQLGEIPENMGLAENEMRGSADQLGRNRPGLSIPHQEKAIEYLQQAMEQMTQQLIARLQTMTIFSMGMGPTDPLGRPTGDSDMPGWWPGAKIKIPDKGEEKRVQEILKTLRKKSGQRNRPDYELDYYNRLLKQF